MNKSYMMMNEIIFLKRQKKFLSMLLLLICSSYSYSQNCDCTEYIYLNEPADHAVLKFEIDAGMVGLINAAPTSPNFPALIQDNVLITAPHGVAMDVNGNLWVGDSQADGAAIRRFNCSGEYIGDETAGAVQGMNDITNTSGTLTNLFYANGFLYGNDSGTGGPIKYDPCTGMPVGNPVCLNNMGSGLAWGMHYDAMTGYVYTTARGPNDLGVIYRYTLAQVDAAVLSGACFNPFIDPVIPPPATGIGVGTRPRWFGVTTDAAGNVYAVARDKNVLDSQIFKYDSAGNFVTSSVVNNTNYPRMMGLVYSMTTDRIYASTADVTGTDCIAVFDTDLNYLGTGATNPETTSAAGKGIAIIKECCPDSEEQIFNRVYSNEQHELFCPRENPVQRN